VIKKVDVGSLKEAYSSATPVVEMDGISLAYCKVWRRPSAIALKDVRFSIRQGETVGFIGNNGAGKSSTLRIILGLQRATSGVAKLNGLSVDNPDARRGVAYVPENPYLYDYLTPLELLSIGVKMHRKNIFVGRQDLNDHCMAWLARFGIAHVAEKRIRTFSKGMTQRTALAHALACEPDFLILDEPLSGLDPIGRQDVVSVLDEYRASGRTLFFSSHVLNDVDRLADRFIFIHQGKIQAICATNDFLSSADQKFAVVIEGSRGLRGFSQISLRLWQRDVEECDLLDVLAMVSASHEKGEVILYAVRNLNSLERAYSTFVKNASAN
jgi:ABC-2 type transport system ATP-binding protein